MFQLLHLHAQCMGFQQQTGLDLGSLSSPWLKSPSAAVLFVFRQLSATASIHFPSNIRSSGRPPLPLAWISELWVPLTLSLVPWWSFHGELFVDTKHGFQPSQIGLSQSNSYSYICPFSPFPAHQLYELTVNVPLNVSHLLSSAIVMSQWCSVMADQPVNLCIFVLTVLYSLQNREACQIQPPQSIQWWRRYWLHQWEEC